MKRLIVIMLCLLMPSLSWGGWLSGYQYRKSHTINAAAGAGVDYQIPIKVYSGEGSDSVDTVYLNGKANYFPNDLAFASSDGTTELAHWREDDNTFWIKITDSLESAPATIYVYYGLSGGDSAKADPINANDGWIWERYGSNPIFDKGAPGQWDDAWINFDAIKKNGSTYYAFYTGSQSTYKWKIGLATSADGDTWSRYGSNPILSPGASGSWDDDSVILIDLIEDGGTYYMLYAGRRSSTPYSIGLATAGALQGPYVKHGSNPVLSPGASGAWDDDSVGIGGSAYVEDGTVYLYYGGAGNATGLTSWAIGLATISLSDLASSPTNWTKSGNNPLLSGDAEGWQKGMSHPHMMKFGPTYYLWYYAQEYSPDRTRVGLATSAAKDSGFTRDINPHLFNGDLGTWDEMYTEVPIIVDMGTHWRMYFCGEYLGNSPMREGYAVYRKKGDGANTFLSFDDFIDYTIDETTKWTNTGAFTWQNGKIMKTANNTNLGYTIKSKDTFNYPIALRAKMKVGADWADEYSWLMYVAWDSAFNTAGYIAGHYKNASNDYSAVVKSAGGGSSVTSEAISANTWYVYDLLVGDATQTALVGGVQKGSLTTSPAVANASVLLGTYRASATSNYTTYFDYVFARKFTDPEPTHGLWGSEENAPPPVVTQVSAVPTPTRNQNPPYTFHTTKAGSITYGGSCSSATTAAAAGDNAITLTASGGGGLGDATYSSCTITVVDAAGSPSNILNIGTFIVDTAAPTDGILMAASGDMQITLDWTAAVDTGSGLALNPYRLVRIEGATPPADCSAEAIYQGAGLSYTDTPLANDQQYAYRLCATDAAGNASAGATAGATPRPSTYTLGVTMMGSGSGDVTDNAGKLSWVGSTATASYPAGDPVQLSADAHSCSYFSGWGDACAGNSSPCTLTMSTDRNVTASFTLNGIVWNTTLQRDYSSIGGAYLYAGDGDSMAVQGIALDEDLLIDRPITVTISGGYDCDFNNSDLMTTIKGLTIADGAVILENIEISGP